MFKFVLITLVLLVATASATKVKQCKKGQPLPISVCVLGCEEPPCDVVKGTTPIMFVHFEGTQDVIRNLTAKMQVSFLGIKLPYALPEKVADVCSNLMYDATCPISKTEDVIYQFNLFVDSVFPDTEVALEVSLIDENDESVACFICDFNVIKGAAKTLMLE